MWYAILVCAIAVLLFCLWRAGLGHKLASAANSALFEVWKDKAILSATVTIEPLGRSEVVLGGRRDADLLLRLFVEYAAKMRCLLAVDKPEYTDVLSVYRQLLFEAAMNCPESPAPGLLEALPVVDFIRQEKMEAQAPWAMMGGERFRVVLCTQNESQRRYFVRNDFTMPGMLFNFAWNAMLLLDAIVARLDEADLSVLKVVLLELYKVMFDPAGDDARTIRGANALMHSAVAAFEGVMRQSQRYGSHTRYEGSGL